MCKKIVNVYVHDLIQKGMSTLAHSFTVVKKGYNPMEVDAYIKGLEQTIEDYKEKTTAINRAIINAQVAADNIIKTAHQETENLLRDAENNAYKIKHKNLNQVVMLRNTVANQRRMIEEFQADYEKMVKKYIVDVQKEDVAPLFNKIAELEDIITELTNSDQKDLQKQEADMAPPQEPLPKEYVQQAYVQPLPDLYSPAVGRSDGFGSMDAPMAPPPNPNAFAPQDFESTYRQTARVEPAKTSQGYEENIEALKDLMPFSNFDQEDSARSILNSEELSELLPFSHNEYK